MAAATLVVVKGGIGIGFGCLARQGASLKIEICSKLRPPDIRGLPCCPLSKLFPNLPVTMTEKQLLLDFKAERSYDSYGDLATWSAEADMCSWSGVSSCTAEGNVESL